MANKRAYLSVIRFVAAWLLLGLCNQAWAQQQAVGVVTHLAGTLSVKRADGSARLLAAKSEVAEGDTLFTEAESYARVKFTDGGEIVLKPNSEFAVTRYHYQSTEPANDSFVVSLVKGGFRAVTGLIGKRSPANVAVKAATATLGIRGTHFGVLDCLRRACDDVLTVSGSVPPEGVHIDVAEGRIFVQNAAGTKEFSAGQFGYIKDAQTLPIEVPPSQGIRVTMPSNISRNNGSGATIGASRDSAACAL